MNGTDSNEYRGKHRDDSHEAQVRSSIRESAWVRGVDGYYYARHLGRTVGNKA